MRWSSVCHHKNKGKGIQGPDVEEQKHSAERRRNMGKVHDCKRFYSGDAIRLCSFLQLDRHALQRRLNHQHDKRYGLPRIDDDGGKQSRIFAGGPVDILTYKSQSLKYGINDAEIGVIHPRPYQGDDNAGHDPRDHQQNPLDRLVFDKCLVDAYCQQKPAAKLQEYAADGPDQRIAHGKRKIAVGKKLLEQVKPRKLEAPVKSVIVVDTQKKGVNQRENHQAAYDQHCRRNVQDSAVKFPSFPSIHLLSSLIRGRLKNGLPNGRVL